MLCGLMLQRTIPRRNFYYICHHQPYAIITKCFPGCVNSNISRIVLNNITRTYSNVGPVLELNTYEVNPTINKFVKVSSRPGFDWDIPKELMDLCCLFKNEINWKHRELYINKLIILKSLGIKHHIIIKKMFRMTYKDILHFSFIMKSFKILPAISDACVSYDGMEPELLINLPMINILDTIYNKNDLKYILEDINKQLSLPDGCLSETFLPVISNNKNSLTFKQLYTLICDYYIYYRYGTTFQVDLHTPNKHKLPIFSLSDLPKLCDIFIDILEIPLDKLNIDKKKFLVKWDPVEALELLRNAPIGGLTLQNFIYENNDIYKIKISRIIQWNNILKHYNVKKCFLGKLTLRLLSNESISDKKVDEHLHVLEKLSPQMIDVLGILVLELVLDVKFLDYFLWIQETEDQNNWTTAVIRVIEHYFKWNYNKRIYSLNLQINLLCQMVGCHRSKLQKALLYNNSNTMYFCNAYIVLLYLRHFGFSQVQIQNGFELLEYDAHIVNKMLKTFYTHPKAAAFTDLKNNPYCIRLLMYINADILNI